MHLRSVFFLLFGFSCCANVNAPQVLLQLHTTCCEGLTSNPFTQHLQLQCTDRQQLAPCTAPPCWKRVSPKIDLGKKPQKKSLHAAGNVCSCSVCVRSGFGFQSSYPHVSNGCVTPGAMWVYLGVIDPFLWRDHSLFGPSSPYCY